MKTFATACGALALAALLGSAAQADPFKFTYTGTIAYASTPGIDSGDTYTLTVIADNGGNSALGQSWGYDDLQGFTIQAGSYSASYSKVWESSDGFQTDASGNVTYTGFYGTSYSSNNSDNFGSWTGDYVYGNGTFFDSQGRENSISTELNEPSRWTVSPAGADGAVPEPASWAMMLGGFGLVGGAMRSRRKATVSFA